MEYTEEQKKRAQECSEKVNALLKEHNCVIDTRVIIDNKGTQIQTSVIAQPILTKIPKLII
jgi:hypothetical protein